MMTCLLMLAAATLSAGESVDDTARAEALVLGGTGRLGAPIVRLLVERGYAVTVFVRPTSNRGRLAGLDVSYVIGDLLNADSVADALRGRQFAVVIDATSRGSAGASFYDTAMRNVLAVLPEGSIDHFILHGSAGAGDNIAKFPQVPFGRMRDILLAKGRAEALLVASGVEYTIIRNGVIRPDGTPASGTARLTADDSVLGTVSRLDLAVLTMQCLDNPDCRNRTFHAVDDGDGPVP